MSLQVVESKSRFQPVFVGGPSGSGKTTLVNELLQYMPDLYGRPTSFTTRKPRQGEGRDEYQFICTEEIQRMYVEGALINLDQAYGHFYAIDKLSLERLMIEGRIPIKEVHPENHPKIREFFPDLISVLVVPESGIHANSMSIRSVDSSRKALDDSFYGKLDFTSFDIIIRIDRTETPRELAKRLNKNIQALLKTQSLFPRGSEIDAQNRTGYDAVAKEFVSEKRPTTRNFHAIQRSFFATALAAVSSKERCLEIGPGQGWLRREFSWPSTDYVGIDISSEMQNVNPETIGCHSARLMPFSSGHFDKAFASLGDPFCYPGALLEIARVLRIGGRLFLSGPCKHWSSSIRDEGEAFKTSFRLTDGSDASVYSFTFNQEELQSLLNLCDLEVKHIDSLTGSMLTNESNISPAILNACEKLRVRLDELPIINVVEAVKIGG